MDSNLYFKIDGDKLLIIIVYVDNIIFEGNDSLCKEFAKEMQKEFEMSIIGELSFFLGLQVIQSENGIFISQSKYVKKMLKKFGFDDCKLVTTPLTVGCKLSKDDESLKVEQNKYRSMIGGLFYLTTSRLDIMQVVCLVVRF